MSRPREIKKEILELHAEGFSYKQICEKLNCSKGTVAYHCGKGQKHKERNRGTKRRKENPLIKKINSFKEDKSKRPSAIKKKKNDNTRNKIEGSLRLIVHTKRMTFFKLSTGASRKEFGYKRDIMFKNKELEEKLRSNPFCYLTGEKIDLMDSQAYSLDHIMPKSRGGDNSIDNCGLTTKRANQMKTDMTVDEFLNACKAVLNHHGYSVEKITEEAAKKALNL
tara:strand:+ start:378 stop:1046 length:669 start_codon:yes stop_codon:yes gene_type:complete